LQRANARRPARLGEGGRGPSRGRRRVGLLLVDDARPGALEDGQVLLDDLAHVAEEAVAVFVDGLDVA
jgi:hypothetical protein